MGRVNGALPASQDRATAAEPVVSALRDGIPSAVGFTGTQQGCAPAQFRRLQGWLGGLYAVGFEWMRNGDCIGADREAGAIWHLLGDCIFLHPPTNAAKRAFLAHERSAEPKPYLTRNRDIVRGSAIMIATPAEMSEQSRGGTWYTIRYARKEKKPLVIIFPDGSYTEENGVAQAIEARRAETGTGLVHESAVRQDAPNPLSPTPHQGNV